MSDYLYIGPRLDGVATLKSDALSETTERHHLVLGVGDAMTAANPLEEVHRRDGLSGVVIGLASGVPDRARLGIAAGALKRGPRLWLYRPAAPAGACGHAGSP